MRIIALFLSLLLIAFLVRRARQLSAVPWAIGAAFVVTATGGWGLWDDLRTVFITTVVAIALVGVETFVRKDADPALTLKVNIGTGVLVLLACLFIGGGGSWESARQHPLAFLVILLGLVICVWDVTKNRSARSIALAVGILFTAASYNNSLLIVALCMPELAALISDIYRARSAKPNATN